MDYEEKYKKALDRAVNLFVTNNISATAACKIFPELNESEEINYEKKYKKALEWMQSLYSGLHGKTKEEAEHYFPELKESDDERISKEIISFLKDFEKDHYRSVNFNSWIAWLEKQGEKKPNSQMEKCSKCQFVYTGYCDGTCILENNEQKPANKVEPKFHEGEWIIHQGTENIYQIITRIDNQYQLKYGDNYTIQNCADVDRGARLWTIEDAKDGDVLTNGEFIVIFKQIIEPKYRQHIEAYIGLDLGGNIQITSESWLLGIDKAMPATKEQRELLFQKMKEAGYEWDSTYKKLAIL